MIACRCGAPFRWAGESNHGLWVTCCINDGHGGFPNPLQDHKRPPTYPPLEKVFGFDGTLAAFLLRSTPPSKEVW